MLAPLLVLTAAILTANAADLSQTAFLDVEERFFLSWDFTDDDITFEVAVNTTGWFGLGFSSNGGMKGADIIIGSVENGKPQLKVRNVFVAVIM